ncbi:uncharacterized protein LOC107613629 [Arachis ipaensis]|uniref:uncharacterized protein LOC107613629 n=1 Tax=Arachis ipaensis TaxID=130454 RepID=UPI000A2B2D84|nr:uncharacterized protein LOC107613629 [Arachis ipaensis]
MVCKIPDLCSTLGLCVGGRVVQLPSVLLSLVLKLSISSIARYENTLVVKLDIAAQEEFKLIEHGLEHIWERYLDPRFRRHPKLLERWFRIHWKKRTTSPPVALKKLILLDKMPRCCRMTSIKRRKRMIILIVECLLIRKIPGT